MEEKEKQCKCNENCTCGEDCTCTEEEKCSEECTCNHDCKCEDEKCNCDSNCNCDDTCDCKETCECGEDCKCEDRECDCDNCNCEEESNTESDTKSVNETKKKGLFHKKDKSEELKKEIQGLQDKVLRQSAEFANYKKRREEETARMLKYSNEDIVKDLLPIIDNFERAIDMDDDNLEDEVSKFLSGFKMIYCNMDQVLEKYGVTEIEALHKEFDPNIHQAVMTEARDGVEPGMVIEVLQKGYRLKDKVIRPSMVKVSE